ncbi:MAG: tRNA 5-methoxyuridine(34)/uridine 5-oxyacetic acid(34) synthase CmoB, partial [Planctomycetota bacterium]
HPWRKGPFELFGVKVDTEWRSDLKWARLAGHVDLKDKCVLDVGCGNGYYLFRMLGAGAKAAIGVDPFLLYVMQFHAINQYVQTSKAAVLPLGVEDIPENCGCFDTAFSMGILYHRREPKEHLQQLHGFLKPGGQAVLETIVLDKAGEHLLVPQGRYGKMRNVMRNVWAIASPALLTKWLGECGFENIEILDITKTTSAEQRKTDWMTFESLDDFLDPHDDAKTVEGYPAPVRAIMLAEKM